MNICRFIPDRKTPDIITTVNFVYEVEHHENGKTNISPVYMMNYVTSGSAYVSCNGIKKQVRKGDIFFLLPAVPYVIEAQENFKYMYISYFGVRASILSERLGINYRNFVFEKFDDLHSFWNEAISMPKEVFDIASESVVLHTLSRIGDRIFAKQTGKTSVNPAEHFLVIKKYIDDNLASAELSLNSISEHFKYNDKYLSSAFKQRFKVGVTEYITTARMQLARILMEQNHTNIKNIAELCGFKDPLYFSKVFKQKIGISPKNYMKQRDVAFKFEHQL